MKIINNDPLGRSWYGQRIDDDEKSEGIWWPGLIVLVIIVLAIIGSVLGE